MSRQKKAPPEVGSWRYVFKEVFNPFFIIWLVMLAILTITISHTVRGVRKERQQLIQLLEQQSAQEQMVDEQSEDGNH